MRPEGQPDWRLITPNGRVAGGWIGSGLDGIDGLSVGDPVTAEQMRALFGCGLQPLAELRQQQLEGPDLTERTCRTRPSWACRSRSSMGCQPVPARGRQTLRGDQHGGRPCRPARRYRPRIGPGCGRRWPRVFPGRAWPGADGARELAGQIAKDSRPRTQTVAGYDLTFSPVKVDLNLVGGRRSGGRGRHRTGPSDRGQGRFGVSSEKHALFTRTGPQGIRQVERAGLVATSFTHRDSRGRRPGPAHTHVAVANKVQTLDGRWLSSTAGCCSRPMLPPPRPTTPRSNSTSATR